MLRKYRCRADALFKIDPIEFTRHSAGYVEVTDDEGTVIEVDHRSLGLTLFALDFHRMSKMPLLKRHFSNEYFNKGLFTSDTFVKWTNVLFWDAYDALEPTWDHHSNFPLLEHIGNTFIDVCGNVYKHYVDECRPYMMGVTLADCIDLHEHSLMRAQREKLVASPDAFSVSVAEVLTMLKTNREFTDRLSRLCRIGAVRVPQVAQCVFALGYRADADGKVFKEPIMSNYLSGLGTPYAMLAEACTSKVATAATGSDLRTSQYTARKAELALQLVLGIKNDDCGSDRLIDWFVPKPDGDVDFIKQMLGIWYLDDSGKYKFIRGTETELHGQTIRIRTALSCKQLPKTGYICRKCYGKISESHMPHSHTGYLSSTDQSSTEAQLQMSRKHHIGTARVVGLLLDPTELTLVVPHGTNEYMLTEKAVKGKGVLYIPHKAAPGINSLIMRGNFDDVAEEAVSELTMVSIEVDGTDTEYRERIVIPMALAKNRASLSYEMLRYIVDNGAVLDGAGDYVVDLSKWNHKHPAFVMPAVSTDDAVDVDAVYESVEGRIVALRKRGVVISTIGILSHLFEILARSGSQLSSVATIMFAILAKDPSNGEYNLGETGLDSVPATLMSRVMSMSAGTSLAFERQHHYQYYPWSMMPTGRLPTPLDTVLCPSVLNRYYRQSK